MMFNVLLNKAIEDVNALDAGVFITIVKMRKEPLIDMILARKSW